MGARALTIPAVSDTNVVISSLVFQEGRLSWVRTEWMSGGFTPVVSSDTVKKLIRVLGYPKFRLTSQEVEALLSDYLPFAETVDVSAEVARTIPAPSDADDHISLALKASSRADFFVSGDGALRVAGAITPEEFLTHLKQSSRSEQGPE